MNYLTVTRGLMRGAQQLHQGATHLSYKVYGAVVHAALLVHEAQAKLTTWLWLLARSQHAQALLGEALRQEARIENAFEHADNLQQIAADAAVRAEQVRKQAQQIQHALRVEAEQLEKTA